MSEHSTEKDVAALQAVMRVHRGGFTTGPYQADDGWRCACGEIVLAEGLPQVALAAWETHLADALVSAGACVLPPERTET